MAKEVHYHQICRVRLQNDAKLSPKGLKELSKTQKEGEKSTTEWHFSRDAHHRAFETLILYINEEILNKKEVFFLADINKYYEDIVCELLGSKETNYNASKLEEKIKNHFEEKIVILKGETIRGNIICSSEYSAEEGIRLADKKKLKSKIKDLAFTLREKIMDADVKYLPEELTVEDIYNGEIEVPDLLTTFITYLIVGPDITRNN